MNLSIKALAIAILMGLGLGLTSCKTQTLKKKPNVIYVFPDQFRKHALGIWQKPEFKNTIRTAGDPVKTPQLDQFASDAIVFTNMVSNSPICSPHRGSLFTGLYPEASGVALNCNSSRPVSSLRQDATCISDVLLSEGYNTAYIGKWHLDYPTPNDPANPGHYVDPRQPAWDAYTPKERRHGFEYWYSYGTWDVHKDPHYYDTDGQRFEPKEWSPKHEADKVIAYLNNEEGVRDEDKPFAIFVSMNPPHNPYQSLDDCMLEDYEVYNDKSVDELLVRPNADLQMPKSKQAAFYFANVTGVDREFGRIIDQLKAMGEYDNTIIVFTSDHGETMCSQGVNDPKNNIYTEAYDVPFIIRYPGIESSRTDNIIMSTPDIMPTLLGLAGLENSIPEEVQGFNYAGVIKGETNVGRPSSALFIKNGGGDKNEEGKTISYFPLARGIKTHHYTLELQINKDHELVATKFFNDDKDPYQLTNLSVDREDPIVQHLLEEMAYWLRQSNDPWYQQQILSDWIKY